MTKITMEMIAGADIKMLKPVSPAALRDAVGEPVTKSLKTEEMICIFIDPIPDANWAHKCYYVFLEPLPFLMLVDFTEQFPVDCFAVEHDWPPGQEFYRD